VFSVAFQYVLTSLHVSKGLQCCSVLLRISYQISLGCPHQPTNPGEERPERKIKDKPSSEPFRRLNQFTYEINFLLTSSYCPKLPPNHFGAKFNLLQFYGGALRHTQNTNVNVGTKY